MFRGALAAALVSFVAWCPVAAEAPLHDPMRPYTRLPPAAEGVTAGGWRLTTILRATDREVAVINGRALTVGERIGDAKLIAIEAWQVTLERGAERIVLPLSRSRVRIDRIEREAGP